MLYKFLLLVAMATHPRLAVSRWSDPKLALVVIDAQDCFLEGGSMAVPKGNDVIPVINSIIHKFRNAFSLVAFSRVEHQRRHMWFSSTHNMTYDQVAKPSITLNTFPNGTTCFDPCDVAGDPHTSSNYELWPDHCLAGVTSGPASSKLASSLSMSKDDVIIPIGNDTMSYFTQSLFVGSNLLQILKSKGINHIFWTGVNMEGKIFNTAVDAVRFGFMSVIVEDATKARKPENYNHELFLLQQMGIDVIPSEQMGNLIAGIKGNSSPNLAHCLPILVTGLFLAIGRSFI